LHASAAISTEYLAAPNHGKLDGSGDDKAGVFAGPDALFIAPTTLVMPRNDPMTRRTLLSAAPAMMVPSVRIGPPEGLPPLPVPGQPAEQVLRALIAWHGGTAGAIAALAEGLDRELSTTYVDDEQYNAIRPRLEQLQDWACWRMVDEAVHEGRIQPACARYGY
jgi:hypothetical protein